MQTTNVGNGYNQTQIGMHLLPDVVDKDRGSVTIQDNIRITTVEIKKSNYLATYLPVYLTNGHTFAHVYYSMDSSLTTLSRSRCVGTRRNRLDHLDSILRRTSHLQSHLHNQ